MKIKKIEYYKTYEVKECLKIFINGSLWTAIDFYMSAQRKKALEDLTIDFNYLEL